MQDEYGFEIFGNNTTAPSAALTSQPSLSIGGESSWLDTLIKAGADFGSSYLGLQQQEAVTDAQIERQQALQTSAANLELQKLKLQSEIALQQQQRAQAARASEMQFALQQAALQAQLSQAKTAAAATPVNTTNIAIIAAVALGAIFLLKR